MKKIIIPIIILFIFPLIANANTEYTEIGSNNTYFRSDTGFFNAELSDSCASTEITCTTRNINSPSIIPMVADLDGDGTSEIIAFDGTTVRLYQETSLNILDSFTSLTTIRTAFIFDIDNDTRKEIIISGNDELEILDWNGTLFTNQTTFQNGLTDLETGSGNPIINCLEIEKCLIIFEEREVGCTPCATGIKYATFNSTEIVEEGSIIDSINNQIVCLPRIGVMPKADYDNDGDEEFIISYGDVGRNQLGIEWLFINDSLALITEQTIGETDIVSLTGGNCGSGNDLKDRFTSPLVFDIDGSSSNGLETVIGFMITTDDFKIYSFSKNGGFLDDYPEIQNGEGILISNMMRANVFTDTANEDFCVMGYQGTTIRRLNMICGSEQTGDIPETLDFVYDLPVTFNASGGFNLITHAGQMSQATTDGNNLDEFINSYGVWRVDFFLIDELVLIWENEKGNSSVIPVDYERNGREDLLVLTDTNLWYIDDGFTNSPGQLTNHSINPCIDRTWKLNTTVEILARVIDIDGDLVSAKAVLYEGTVDEQDSGWSNNASSGTTFPFAFIANITTPASTLSIYGRDVENPNENTSVSKTFSVSTDGVSRGDCITTDTLIPTIEDEDEDITPGSTLRNVMTGGGAIPESWHVLVAIGVIVAAWVSTFVFLIELAKEAPQLANNQLIMFFVPILAALLAWIFVILADLMPAWTIFAGIVIAAAAIGLRFYGYLSGNTQQM